MNIRVLLVDDHTMFREALRLMLEKTSDIEVIGELGDGSLIVETVGQLAPDVVVMDVSMPHVNGMDATRCLLARYPKVRVVALSAYAYKQFIMEMMDAGAIAYVVKSAAGEKLVDAIHSAMAGKTYLCSEAAQTIVEASRRGGPATPGVHERKKRLGRRETEVLRLLAQGRTSPQIAEDLHIATSTVDVHRRNIMQKLELHSVAELTKYAVRAGLTDV
jgi:DNA-binding NarL/FixJ family response regulator